ncbi:K02A2.6-like [Cordylochernes scorpioides]|uniref:RNA-directed DNA polymerase n=1 Tax=Cordylochernes scorpioides TaxID=51811 RepID=A0ABY6K7V9_9ARAC|nr:K02A2.6-like [Cordylochernes scorpioides]
MLTKKFEAQQEDTTLKAVFNYLEQGWSDKKKMSQDLLSYWHVKDELGVQNGLLMRSCRLVIPASMKLKILDKLHAGHFGITKTRLRARETVWWPGISEEIAETVRRCSVFTSSNEEVAMKNRLDKAKRLISMIRVGRLSDIVWTDEKIFTAEVTHISQNHR